MTIRSLFLVAFFAGAILLCRGRADASLHVCDRSPQPATVALALIQTGPTGTVTRSEGWWQVDAGTCSTLIDAPLQPGAMYYLYGKSPQYFWSGDPKKGTKDAQFCANVQDGFDYTDRDAAACTGANDRMLWFIHEPVNREDWTIDLYMPS